MTLDHYVITLDVDWASDEVIAHCAEILVANAVKATWLVTHDCSAVGALSRRDDLFELGIHPNFHAGSTQGDEPRAVLDHLAAIVPQARSVRTHGLYQSTELLRLMLGDYGIENDLSLLLPDTPGITPHEFHLPEGVLRRFPTFWEDDAEMLRPQPSFSLDDARYHVAGLKIFTFHPVLVALNARSLEPYQRLKREHDISRATLDDLAPYANDSGPGDGTFFRELVAHVGSGAAGPSLTVSELARAWMESRDDE
jgi:hypothetical protein